MDQTAQRAKELFLALAGHVPAAEWDSRLDEMCAGNTALRQRVLALLRAHVDPRSYLDPPAVDMTLDIEPSADISERAGTQIGPYKLLQEIGQGGMGVVYVAEQKEPVERQVALKIIKPGMDTQQVIARFEAERQALAMMDHPNIAKVLDAGATDSGRPYFVMELVQGNSITRYCDEHQLTPRQRLELFVPVCHAVQHAHQKGIIHRDIKPTNVLVAEYDDRAVPKIIDFGVAKAIQQRLTEQTAFTQFGQVVGTVDYMSPEQAGLNDLDIDTRSDVYSLGVLLYELLTGETPLDRQRLRSAVFDEMLRIIREEEPPRPSVRLSSSDTLPSIAANRHIEPTKLSALVRGELDWIVMKALEKDRTRRYETANGLGADIERYLSDEPVLACPPSVIYRLRKFARRNKGPMVAASLLLLVFVGGLLGTTWGLLRAERARQSEAERAAGERRAKQEAQAANVAERKARETAQARDAETQAVLDFVETNIFAAAQPEGQDGGLGHDVTLRQAIEAALPLVEKGFADQPLIEARLRMTLGISFSYLGDEGIAAQQNEIARALYTKHLGPEHPETLRCVSNLGVSYVQQGRYADACTLYEETRPRMQATLGSDHPDTLRCMNNLATSLYRVGRYAEALTLREETFALMNTTLGPGHPDTLRSMNNLASSYLHARRNADALQLYQKTLARRKATLGPHHPDTLLSMNNLANFYSECGQHPDALRMYEETVPLMKEELGTVHPHTLRAMDLLAVTYEKLGRVADAFKIRQQKLEMMKAELGAADPDTLKSMFTLANLYVAQGQHTDALTLREESLATWKAKAGPDHPATLSSMLDVADSLVALDRGAEAVPMIDECLMRAADKLVPAQLIAELIMLRLRHYEKTRSADGCRQTAEMWEKLGRTDAGSLYNAACLRAVTATVTRAGAESEVARQPASADADKAMDWLQKAVTAGFHDVDHLKKDQDLDPLRDREDFKTLLDDLEAARQKQKE